MQLDGCTVHMDTAISNRISVIFDNEVVYTFYTCHDGLFYIDIDNLHQHKSTIEHYCFLELVKDNKKFFSVAEIAGAERAQLLQQQIGWPSLKHYEHILNTNQLRNCNVTVDNFPRAESINGTAVPLLKGKMTRVPQNSGRIPQVEIPSALQ